ncbi:hypothetical protein SPRG_08910 [Saprolegnia parasitica CBS 223.65]|uniref:Uncharacterized protein n=1 Tax=Saprolegnia parasitica (strain CBS 223.65) TaxID=695850 RepID=A0A067CGD6_SAPPC|nr:hypothetical protein SPRG_08910 [Saprolegnia parasitica CBS 223.65]KDO25611.1 hypothetical protein SPRG_08910 [Saprolegnia parasitica CBS 223.65]|eukprot:XP_012203644.1 hypothetical protein SPRG_08910 [Saprolegnia parasitica CBS 223.65]
MHAGVVCVGVLAHAFTAAWIAYTVVAPGLGWSLVSFSVHNTFDSEPPTSVSIAFSPKEYCLTTLQHGEASKVCLAYGADALHTTLDPRLLEFVASTWCGCSVSRRFDIGATMKHAVCSVVMSACHYTMVYVLAPTALLAAVLYVASLVYFKEENIVGKMLGALNVMILIGILMILGTWLAFDRQSYLGTTQHLGAKTPAWLYGEAIYGLGVSVVCLCYCVWLSSVVVKSQTLKYINRRHLRELKRSPLTCPANYA